MNSLFYSFSDTCVSNPMPPQSLSSLGKGKLCAQTSTPPQEAAAAHTAPAHIHTDAWHPSMPSVGGESKVSWHYCQCHSTFQILETSCWTNMFFFYWLTPSQHLALSARWWNSTGQWSAGKPVPTGLQRSTSPTAICPRPLESPHSALSLPKPPGKCAHHSLTSLSPELALAACSACSDCWAEPCSAGGIPDLQHMLWGAPCGHPSWAGSPAWLQRDNISCSLSGAGEPLQTLSGKGNRGIQTV